MQFSSYSYSHKFIFKGCTDRLVADLFLLLAIFVIAETLASKCWLALYRQMRNGLHSYCLSKLFNTNSLHPLMCLTVIRKHERLYELQPPNQEEETLNRTHNGSVLLLPRTLCKHGCRMSMGSNSSPSNWWTK